MLMLVFLMRFLEELNMLFTSYVCLKRKFDFFSSSVDFVNLTRATKEQVIMLSHISCLIILAHCLMKMGLRLLEHRVILSRSIWYGWDVPIAIHP